MAATLSKRISSVFFGTSRTVTHWSSASAFGPIGVCAYIIGLALPLKTDFALLVLAFCSLVALAGRLPGIAISRTSLALPLVMFLAITGLSILWSVDAGHSLRLSAVLLPAVLLFFIVSDYFDGYSDLYRLYLVLTTVALVLSCMVLWAGWKYIGVAPTVWVPEMGSPVLLVPNDGVFLALVAPFSFILLHLKTNRLVRLVAMLSLLLSVCAVVILSSRVALLTLLVSVCCAAGLLKPRLALVWGSIVVLAALLFDAGLGFPLLTKFASVWDARISLWLVAWAMFLDAPLVGHGPYTFGLLYQSYLSGLQLPHWVLLDPHVNVPWAHSLYLEVLAERGLLGMGSLCVLMGGGIVTGWKAWRSEQEERRMLATAALGALVGLCVAGIFELTLMRQWVAITLFILVGILAQLSSLRMKSQEVDRWNNSLAA
jgi:O-antigen ligase